MDRFFCVTFRSDFCLNLEKSYFARKISVLEKQDQDYTSKNSTLLRLQLLAFFPLLFLSVSEQTKQKIKSQIMNVSERLKTLFNEGNTT